MKLSSTDSESTINAGVFAPVTFQIKANRQAFTILSSGLYNDKILACIRELSCNALDSHIQAGKKDEPFEVHLPTVLEPWFSVKDSGVGLDHVDLLELYCTYFASNKNDSNDTVGALGLGSKSPFCYTDGFTVTSCYNGKKRIYDAHLGDGGPEALLLAETDTDEPNGLEVQFPVKSNNVWEFETKAKVAFEFFNPLPTFNKEIDIHKTEYLLRTSDWGSSQNSGSIPNQDRSRYPRSGGLCGGQY
jgi:hypothetical protein